MNRLYLAFSGTISLLFAALLAACTSEPPVTPATASDPQSIRACGDKTPTPPIRQQPVGTNT